MKIPGPKWFLRGALSVGLSPDQREGAVVVATTMACPLEALNAMWVRCPAWGQMNGSEPGPGKYRCGQLIQEHPPYLSMLWTMQQQARNRP